MFFFTGQQDRAIEQLKKVIEMDPDFPITHLFLAMAYEQKGNHQSAIAELEKHAQTAGGRTIFSAELGYVYGRSGRRDLGALLGADPHVVLDLLQLRGRDLRPSIVAGSSGSP